MRQLGTLFLLAVIVHLCSAKRLMDTPAAREYFYVGGHYRDDGTGTGQHIFTEQMYVEKLTPSNQRPNSQQRPIVFIHGQAQTGTNWLNKPDGSSGWASYFLSKGHTIYLVDQTFRARSAWSPATGLNISTYSAELLQQRFTAPEKYNLWPQAARHTQWPGTGLISDPYFDAYYASTVQFITSAAEQQSSMQTAGAALLDRIAEPVILLTHSQGGPLGWLIADANPQMTEAIVAIEPTGPPFREAVFTNTSAREYGLTDIPLTYAPPVVDPKVDLVQDTIPAPRDGLVECILQAKEPKPRQLTNLQNIPVVVVSTEASYHAPYDWCTVEFLRQAGVKTEHIQLPEIGIHGNAHMVFLEKNSDQVAGVVQRWIEGLER